MRPIDGDALVKYCNGNPFITDSVKTYIRLSVATMPTIEERKTGKWQITDAYPHNVYCSECHKRFAQTHWAVWEDGSLPRNFCPNCGARLVQEGEDNGQTT